MSKSFGCYMALSFFLGLGSQTLADGDTPNPSEPLMVSVILSNYTPLPKETLAEVVNEAEGIFRHAGVNTVWPDCAPSSAAFPDDPACPKHLDPTVLFVRILSGSMTEGFGLHHSTCGVAASAPNGGFGSYAYVFFDCVQELAGSRGARSETILSHMLAHEIGHLLLGPGSHSRRGIMHEDWDRQQVESAGWGRLLFTRQQAERMQAEVRRRSLAGQIARKR